MTQAEIDFAELELRWVRQVRKTRNPEMLHLVEAAVKRERALIEQINEARREPQLFAADHGPTYGSEDRR